MRGASNVSKGLVNGNSFDERGEVIEHRDGGIAQPLVVLEVTINEGQLRAEFARQTARHATPNAEDLSFVRRGEHDTAPDRDWLAAQRRVEQLLDRGIEGIQVSVKDGSRGFHPNSSPARH